MSALNVVDSSGWLEYFIDSPRAGHFSVAVEDGSTQFSAFAAMLFDMHAGSVDNNAS